MKKLIPILLALSLVANAALILTRPPGPPAFAQPNAARPTGPNAKTTARAAALPDGAELATLQEKLISAGLPPDIVNEAMRNMLWKPFRDRQRAMLEAKNAGKPYWQQTGGAGKKQLTADERAELRALSEQIEARATAIFGDEHAGRATSRYSFLPAEKAAALYQLHRDYSDIHDGVNDETSLFRLPSDDSGRKLLRQEQRRDLEAILTPAELAEYDLHYSPTATELRKRFAALPDSTENEYKTAFAIAQNAKGDAASQALAAQQLGDLLGPDRYAAFLRANDSDYTALQGAAARFDLPAATVEKVYGLRDQAISLSQQIAADTTLSAKDKQLALKNLAGRMRNDVRDNLGKEIGNAYLDKNMNWLGALADGNVINSTPTGKITAKSLSKDNPAGAGNTGGGKTQQKNAAKPEKGKAGKKSK